VRWRLWLLAGLSFWLILAAFCVALCSVAGVPLNKSITITAELLGLYAVASALIAAVIGLTIGRE
jgi:hypothetical protein